MKPHFRWVVAAVLSISMLISADFAEAKAKHKDKTHKSQVHKKKSAKKFAKKQKQKHVKTHKKSQGYAKAASYLQRDPASAHEDVKPKKATKSKKAKKVRRT